MITAQQINTLIAFIDTSKQLIEFVSTTKALPANVSQFYQQKSQLPIERVKWRVNDFGDLTFMATINGSLTASVTFNNIGSTPSNIMFGGYVSSKINPIEVFTGCISTYAYGSVLTLIDSKKDVIEVRELSQSIYR